MAVSVDKWAIRNREGLYNDKGEFWQPHMELDSLYDSREDAEKVIQGYSMDGATAVHFVVTFEEVDGTGARKTRKRRRAR